MTTTARIAEPLATETAPATARIERLLPGSIDRVWSYITDSDKRAKWFASGPMDLRVGGEVSLTWRNSDLSDGMPRTNGTLPADGIDHVMTGVITRCEPPHVLSFNWSLDGSGSESTFELTQEGPDTRLIITQARTASRTQMINMSAGWHVHVGILADLLSGAAPRSFWPEHARLVAEYETRFGA